MSTFAALIQLRIPPIDPADGWVGLVIPATLLVLYVAVMWRLFEKGGEEPWLGPIPVVNLFYLARIAGKSRAWGLLLLIPVVGSVMWFVLCIALAHRFGRSTLFGVGLALLPVIFFPELAFGRSELVPEQAEVWRPTRGMA